MDKVQVDSELVKRIKRILIEFSSPTIAMSVLFEALGYQGLSGVMWGVLVGAVSVVATELGYEVTKLGTIWTINKPISKNNDSKEISALVTELGFGKKTDTNHQNDGSDKEEKNNNGKVQPMGS